MEKYKFDRNRKRVETCPCGKSNSDVKFAPFLGFDSKGYCHSCNKAFFPDRDLSKSYKQRTHRPKKTDYIPKDTFKASTLKYYQDNFSMFLKGLFGDRLSKSLIDRYNIGCIDKYPNATVFWQMDIKNELRSGKIIHYDEISGKRKKNEHITWIHSVNELKNYELNQCLFGEHLIVEDTSKKIALVESEKTAIICSPVFPEFIWLATGGSAGLKEEKLKVLIGREIILFPDLGFYNNWMSELSVLSVGINFVSTHISDFLEKRANRAEFEAGYDLADFVLMNRDEGSGWLLNESGYPLFWDLN